MPHTPETPPTSIESRLSEMQDITDEAKKNKVELTPEVSQYIREHLQAVQQKLANKQPVTEDDMKFMQDVRLWVGLPEDLRVKYINVEEVQNSEEVREIIVQAKKLNISLHEAGMEAKNRQISTKQWLDLLHVMEAAEQGGECVDDSFKFPGDGRIETVGWLNLTGCTSLTTLPAGLRMDGDLDLRGCTSLVSLPAGLKVDGNLYLGNCTSLTSIPSDLKVNGDLDLMNCTSLTSLPPNLKVNGNLAVAGCTSLISLPAGLKVDRGLDIDRCTSLTSLPSDMEVAQDLYLTKNLHEQVIKDAERLKKERKIKGNIEYDK